MTWRSADGLITRWSSTPPSGPMYFDSPPDGVEMHYDLQSWESPRRPLTPPNGPVYFDPPPLGHELGEAVWVQGYCGRPVALHVETPLDGYGPDASPWGPCARWPDAVGSLHSS